MIAALREAGYEPVLLTTSSEEELDAVLDGISGLVVSAGGDGTFRAVATRLLGKKVPLTHLLLGTANNVGHSLCLNGNPLEILADLKNPVKRYFDVGIVTAPGWKSRSNIFGHPKTCWPRYNPVCPSGNGPTR